MKKRYSIGETSNIVGISIDRLRNYDKINLIKPAYVDEKTGYRYYIGDQFRRLRFIKYLRKIGVPLKEIEMIINEETSSEKFILFLHTKINEIENEIENLKVIKKDISELKDNMEYSMKRSNIPHVYVKNIEERYAICKRVNKSTEFIVENREDIFEKFRAENKEVLKKRTIEKGIYIKDYNNVSKKSTNIFIIVKDGEEYNNFVIPEGTYLCLSYKENNRKEAIEKLRKYIKDNNIVTKGICLNVILYTMPKEEFELQVLI
ncbi:MULTISPECIES: MerR family transcriptional regulator [Clostridium]|uniref:Helix-turn-helix domain-containing protein n=2 Tax=Clostridium TaxID=1485 RepID=A0ABP3X207_9CLOT|nr:MerR family transcriptional regulator [Clostridium baratii]STB00608.1 MerR family transcriptional regulator [Clostridium baratii]